MKRVSVVAELMVLTVLTAGSIQAVPEQGYSVGKNTWARRALKVGDPVSAASGAFSFALPLLDLGGPMGLQFTLQYDQDSDSKEPIGRSGFPIGNPHFWWSPAAVGNFFISYGGPMNCVHLPDGATVNFVQNDAGEFVLYEGSDEYPGNASPVRYVMKGTADYIYLLDPSAERVYIFERETCLPFPVYVINPVRYVLDRNGNQLVYEYNASLASGDCELVRIHDTLGRSLQFTFADVGGERVLQAVTDQGGRRISFTYEQNAADNGNCTTVRAVTDAMDQTVTFLYQTVTDGGGNPFLGNIVSVQYPNGNIPYVNELAYKSVALPGFEPMEAARVVRQTDAYGNAMTLTYAADTYRTTVAYPDGNSETYQHAAPHAPPTGLTDSAGASGSFGVNGQGQTTSVSDRLGCTTSFTYHPDTGHPASITNALGKTAQYTYTAQDQTFTNPANNETVTFTFYNLTRITYPDGRVMDLTHDARGNVLTRKDQAGNVWLYTYDDRGQLLTVTNPDGGVATSVYNQDGTLASSRDSDTPSTTYEYDALKRPTKVIRPGGHSVSMAYDLCDRVLSVTDENGRSTHHEYDANGNRTRTTDARGATLVYAYDQMDRLERATNRLNRSSTMAYDSRSRLASVNDPNGLKTEYSYDGHGWRTGMTVDGKTWQTVYDAEGVVTSRITPLGRRTAYTSDKLGRTTEFTDPLTGRTRFAYDDQGRLLSTTDPLERVTARTYDPRGLLTRVTLPNGTAAQYAYTASARLQQITDLNGNVWRFAYTPGGRLASVTDPLGQRTTQTYNDRGWPAVTTYPDASTLTRTYDGVGNLLQNAYSGGLVQTYAYDALNRLTSTDGVAFEYDDEGHVTASVQNGRRFAATYDAGGRLSTVGYNNDALTVSYTYNARGLLAQVSDNRGGSATFIYDDDNRLTGLNRSNGVNSTYEHDAAGQRTRIREGAFADVHLTYNAAGDITGANLTAPLDPSAALTPEAATWSYDAAAQANSAGSAHDSQGRVTAAPGHTFTWDAASRLTGIDGVRLEYNGLGKLTRRTEGRAVTQFYTHQAIGLSPVVAELDGAGTAVRYYVWTPSGQLLWYYDETASGARYFYHFDQTGSTMALTDASGAVTDAYAYEPFGRLLKHEGTRAQPFTFLGQWGVRQEGATGTLYHARARYYDATTGRFISREPQWPTIGDPQTLNPYQYARNSPVAYSDATGSAPKSSEEQWDELNAKMAAMRSRSIGLSAAQYFVRNQVRPSIYVSFEEQNRVTWLGRYADQARGAADAVRWNPSDQSCTKEERERVLAERERFARDLEELYEQGRACLDLKHKEEWRIQQTIIAEAQALMEESAQLSEQLGALLEQQKDLERRMRLAGFDDEFFSKHALPKKNVRIRAELIGKSKIPLTFVAPYEDSPGWMPQGLMGWEER